MYLIVPIKGASPNKGTPLWFEEGSNPQKTKIALYP